MSEYQSICPNSVIITASIDPFQAARDCRVQVQNLEFGYRRELYECLAGAYAIAREFIENEAAWRSFIEDPFWSKSKRKPRLHKNRNQALKFVVAFVFSAKNARDQKKVWKYQRALSDAFNSGVPARKISALLETSGGLERLSRAAKPKRKTPPDEIDLDSSKLFSTDKKSVKFAVRVKHTMLSKLDRYDTGQKVTITAEVKKTENGCVFKALKIRSL